MKSFILPYYDNCLVNLANSILKSFGAETSAGTLALADKYLAAGYKNVVVLLLDAMGTSIIEKHLEKDGFFRSHLAGTFDSVYPPTTVAATTSVLSGLYPCEHGWLGWDMYYPELDKNVTVFTNTEQTKEKKDAAPTGSDSDGRPIWGEDSLEEDKPAAEFNAGFTYTPYQSIIDKINKAGGRAYYSIPFVPPHPNTLDAILDRVSMLCEEPERKFIYAYWDEPDHTMHRTGIASVASHDLIVALEKRVEEFASSLSYTLLFVIADHSHIDCRNLCILDHPRVLDCLVRMPSIEPRTLNLFVRDDRKEAFPAIFREEFGDAFLLLTREEVLEKRLFGTGNDRPDLPSMIGDFVALSISDVSIFNTHLEVQAMPGGHAGMTREEYEIPLIVIER